MKKRGGLLAFAICTFFGNAYGQTPVPYTNNFDNPGDSIGWMHSAISGADDWRFGTPQKYRIPAPYTTPNAWVTYLKDGYEGYSNRILQTPSFDLTDQSMDYVLSFFQKTNSNSSGAYCYLEYSIDGGAAWQLLDNVSAQKGHWQTNWGFDPDYYYDFRHSAINISFLQGMSNVMFRFRYETNYPNGDGWMIDNFSIAKEQNNFYATKAMPMASVSPRCPEFTLKTRLGFYTDYSTYVSSRTNYYFSKDSILDVQDSLIGTDDFYIAGDVDVEKTFSMLPNLHRGYYYIIYKHDALNALQEDNENDNVGFGVLEVDSIYNLPYVQDFENSADEQWKPYATDPAKSLVWDLGQGYRHHLEGTHSGMKAWHTSKSIDFDFWNCGNSCNSQYVESPFLDMTSVTGNLMLSMWFKANADGNIYSIEYTKDCDKNWYHLVDFPFCRDDEWDFVNISLSQIALEGNVKFRIKYVAMYTAPEGLMFDDVYIGIAKPDITIERDKQDRFTSTTIASDVLKYYLSNSGMASAPQTNTEFYWSNDTILDGSDILLGTKQETALTDTARTWTSFSYTKPTTAAGKYYIFYVADKTNVANEMRESNNSGYFTLHQSTPQTTPYLNDFETQTTDWRHNSSLGKDEWQWTTPKGKILDKAFSGQKVWITNDTGLVSPMSRMHLYTPVYDLSAAQKPVLEFDMKLSSDGAICACAEGKINMSYSIDGGATWIVLDTTNQSYNKWYYPMVYNNYGQDGLISYNSGNTNLLFELSEVAFAPMSDYNGRDVARNTRYILDLSFLAGKSQVQFRFNLATLKNKNGASPNPTVEGAMIDNFSIKESYIDLNIDYKKALMISSAAQKIKFFMHVKNQGNYITAPSLTKYYLSQDTLLNGSDFFLGQDTLPTIRPDRYQYVNKLFNGPGNLDSYKYLLYELDALQANAEADEINNVSYWPLALDSIKTYPYQNNFSDTVVNGWHQYSLDGYDKTIIGNRFMNKVPLAWSAYQTGVSSNQWYTEPVLSGTWNKPPTYYLETPAFDFSKTDEIVLSFDLLCTGRSGSFYQDGGNFQFSIDGGNTWEVLTAAYGPNQGWFNYSSLSDLDNEAGWDMVGCNDPSLFPASFDASFLKGKQNVVFRFKYRSNWETCGGGTVQGMRIDNFGINAVRADYAAKSTTDSILASISQPNFDVNYSISNKGQSNGRPTTTKFYWSKDNVYDSGDSLIRTVAENPVSSGATTTFQTTITYPSPIAQSVYYLFYFVDGNDSIFETDETNNMGLYKVIFDGLSSIKSQTLNKFDIYVSNKSLYINAPESPDGNPYTIMITNTLGQMIHTLKTTLDKGANVFNLPDNIPSGVYLVSVNNGKAMVTKRAILQN